MLKFLQILAICLLFSIPMIHFTEAKAVSMSGTNVSLDLQSVKG